MANRAFKRNIGTLDNELIFVQGVVTLSGSLIGGVAYPASCSISHTLTGTFGTGSAGVSHPNTGSFVVLLKDVYPSLQSAQFTLFGDSALDVRVVGNSDLTMMGSLAYASGTQNTSQIGFKLVSGSGGVYEPTGSLAVHVSLALKNSRV